MLGLIANEICDFSPWHARKILRRAYRGEANDEAEAELILAEQLEVLESIPGRIAKLAWAVGRLRFGLHLSLARFTGLLLDPMDAIDEWQLRGAVYLLATFTITDG